MPAAIKEAIEQLAPEQQTMLASWLSERLGRTDPARFLTRRTRSTDVD